MRKAEDFISDYRERGYDDERIRVLASLAREPLRSDVLGMLGPSEKMSVESSTTVEDSNHPGRGSPEPIREKISEKPAKSESAINESKPESAIYSIDPVKEPPQENTTGMEKEIARLKAELARSKQRISELEEEAAAIADASGKVDELNEEVGRSHTREAELQAQVSEARQERKEAESRADELALQMKEKDGSLTHLRAVLADKEKQLAELRGRSEGDELRIKRDLETECRRLKKRSDYYRKLAFVSTAAAGLIFVVSIFTSKVGNPAPAAEPTETVQATNTNNTSTVATTQTPASRDAGAVTATTTTRDSRAVAANNIQRPRPINSSDGELVGVTGSPVRPSSSATTTAPPSTTTTAPQPAQPRSAATETARPRTITYEVKKNDSLWKICRDVLGDPTAVNRVARENNLSDPSRLQPGMKLTLTVASND